jgi:hypothetical protein
LLYLVEPRSAKGAANADGPAGVRIDTTQPERPKARAAPIATRDSETRACARQRGV